MFRGGLFVSFVSGVFLGSFSPEADSSPVGSTREGSILSMFVDILVSVEVTTVMLLRVALPVVPTAEAVWSTGGASPAVVIARTRLLLEVAAPVVVTEETVDTTGELIPLPSDALEGGKDAPAVVVARGLEGFKLELLVELAGAIGVGGITAEFELGLGVCCSGPDRVSTWLRWE